MKILKEEKIEEYECPKCNTGLEFDYEERKEDAYWWKVFGYIFNMYDPGNGNAWFECERCNRRYLIKDYAKVEEKDE